ncbi:hypothetical protein MSA03_02220 [Microbacterium saccharophilum]|nr:hypothetical protein MSA03_02220 [Microbacterium saccharophilum]
MPSVLKTGPGRWMTYVVGRTVRARSAISATVSAQIPVVTVRDIRRRGAGVIVTFSSNSATGDLPEPVVRGRRKREVPVRGLRGEDPD